MTPDIGVSVHYNEHKHYTSRLLPEVRMVIERYTPQLAHAEWLRVAEFVREIVVQYAPGSVGVARDALRLVAQLCVWGDRRAIPIGAETILDPDVIERFLHDERMSKSPAVASRDTSRLLKVTAALISAQSTFSSIPRVGTFPLPYTLGDEPELLSWAAQQTTPEKRQAAHAMLGLCRGAGLRKDELLEVVAGDVTRDSQGIVVAVRGKFSRVVPVDETWADEVERGIVDVPRERILVFPNRHLSRPEAIKSLSRSRGQLRVVCTRLRSSWIRDRLHLSVGTLVQGAGFSSPQALDPYFSALKPLDESQLLEALRVGH